MHVVVLVEGVEEFTDFGGFFVGEGGELLGDVTEFARDHRPAVGAEPLRGGGSGGALGDEARALAIGGNVVVLLVGERLDFVCARFDGGFFGISGIVGVVGFHEADVVEEKLVAAADAELASLEEDADLGGGAVLVVGIDLDDDGDLVRGVALEDHVIEDDLFAADPGAFLDGALDDVAGDGLLARLFESCEQPGITRRVRPAEFSSDHDFFDEFTGGLRLFQRGDRSFSEEPLATHRVVQCTKLRPAGKGGHSFSLQKVFSVAFATCKGSTAGALRR